MLSGSPSQVNQVFMNLLGNAEEAIESEGNVWIRTCLDGDRVVVQSCDDGKGIAADRVSEASRGVRSCSIML